MKKPHLTKEEINNFKDELIKLLEKYDVYIYSALEGETTDIYNEAIEIVENKTNIEIIRVEGYELDINKLKKL